MGFLFLILYPASSALSSSSSAHLRPLLRFGTHHLSHITLSHTIFHTPSLPHHLCHTPSFTHHLCHTPSLSHHLCHTPSFTHTIFVNHHLSHTPSFTHHLSHTHLCQPPSFTHHLSHNHPCRPPSSTHYLSHTIFHTPSLSTTIFHIPSFTHHLFQKPSFTHHLSHTIFVTTIFVTTIFHTPFLSTTIFHTPSFTHHLCHHNLSHTGLCQLPYLRGTTTFVNYHLCQLPSLWQAWHLVTSTFVSHGKRGTWWHPPSFRMASVALGDIPPSFRMANVALGDIHLRFAWQAGTYSTGLALVALVAGTTLSHTTFRTQLCHTPSLTHHLWHTLFHTPSL